MENIERKLGCHEECPFITRIGTRPCSKKAANKIEDPCLINMRRASNSEAPVAVTLIPTGPMVVAKFNGEQIAIIQDGKITTY